MKNYILILFLFASIVGSSQEFNGGIIAGLITSQVDGDSWSGYNKSSFSAGVFVNREITDRSAAQMELRYIRKGAIQDDTKTGGLSYYRSRLNYIELPFLGQYTKGNFIFEGGIAFGVLINSSEEDLSGIIPDDQTKEFHRIEWSALGGFSYQVLENIRINFRFQYSILPVRDNFSDDIEVVYYHQQYSYNNVLGFSVYYFL